MGKLKSDMQIIWIHLIYLKREHLIGIYIRSAKPKNINNMGTKLSQTKEGARRLIRSGEPQVSVIQLLGFGLIVIGVFYILFKLFYFSFSSNNDNATIEGEEIALAFFITMLGVAFAFPDLLQDQTGGLSTMRIVVFMMVNVICILMLKIGWGKTNFADIGINNYWVGIIAFVFGSKATQSFFESRMATSPPTPLPPPAPSPPIPAQTSPIPQDQLARLAIEQNGQSLKAKFPNIVTISDTVNNLGASKVHIVAIYLKDDNISGIPNSLTVNLPNGTIQTINTEIITSLGTGAIHLAQSDDSINTHNVKFWGSIGSLVKGANNFYGAVTSGHVYTYGVFQNYGMIPAGQNVDFIDQTGAVVASGTWHRQEMTVQQDLAVAKLSGPPPPDPDYISFQDYYAVSDDDVQKLKVNVVSRYFNPRNRTAYILDNNVGFQIPYNGVLQYMNNIIMIGNDKDRNNSQTVSQPGDSGGCVYTTDDKGNNLLIGLIVGGDFHFTWVLPIKDTLDNYGLTLL